MGTSTGPTYFGEPSIQYPELTHDDRIPIHQFLIACDGTVRFIGFLGSAFGLVSKDVSGNVTKLKQQYEHDERIYNTVEELLEAEMNRRASKKQYTHTLEGVLWLKRALDFMRHVLYNIISQHESDGSVESVVQPIKSAYSFTLKKHHSLPVQVTFRGFMMLTPNKSNFLKNLAGGRSKYEKEVVKDIKQYLDRMSPVVDKLVQFYDKNNLENDKTV